MSTQTVLRIIQTSSGGNGHRTKLQFTSGDSGHESAVAEFSFTMADQDREDLRWYLEDYLEYPIDPTPQIADRVEARMRELGTELHGHLFGSGPEGRRLWARLEPELPATRVEIASEVDADAVLPWELLRDPRGGIDLAVRARSFVRVQRPTARPAVVPRVTEGETIRVLLVICRPGGREDVPFRSVASHLFRLSAARQAFRLDVLRPATFEQLTRTLGQAADSGTPYHVVHFDGHGIWTTLDRDPRPGPHGYLVFERPGVEDNVEFVDGVRLGSLLARAGVPVLVLNACQSAYADLALAPANATTMPKDLGTRVRAYGSLAQEVVDAGVAGVVAMRYSVYVVTAAQFVADLYAALLDGLPLGEAVTVGRKQLAAQPDREIAFSPLPLRDWVVPVVYEASPLRLFSRSGPAGHRQNTLDRPEAGQEWAALPLDGLPPGSELGFYGRDATLLDLDRAFDDHQVVLLHAFAGAGKTTTAVEFARWYRYTGGVDGPVLFTSFEQHVLLARLLGQLGAAFEDDLERDGVHWLALDQRQRVQLAARLLRETPVLWIWDNVEQVAGFPAGTPSAWSSREQEELAGFLREIRGTRAKVLLTSRRDERGWLGRLPVRVPLPPMPVAERVQLARAIGASQGHRLTEVQDWRPLLAYTQGNPLTVTVLVTQALRERVRTREEVERFVARLRDGEADVADDQPAGRSRSLGASLAYGFHAAFSDSERAVLALLHLFQGFVNVDALRSLGDRNLLGEGALEVVRGMRSGRAIKLLERAKEIGLLTRLVRGFYQIHPALPWYLADLFRQHHGPPGSPADLTARRAYVTVMADFGDYAKRMHGRSGTRTATSLLGREEANLLHAFDLARRNGWSHEMVRVMQGLDVLYASTGRVAEWARLVDQVTIELTDPVTGGPRQGQEWDWVLLTEYRVDIAVEARDWETAMRLQRARVAWNRERVAELLTLHPVRLSFEQRGLVRTLAAAMHTLGRILSELDDPGCVEAYAEALELFARTNDRRGQALSAINLGNAYRSIPAIQDLDKAEGYYRSTLDLCDERDLITRSQAMNGLGNVHQDRLDAAAKAGRPAAELLVHLNAAARAYRQALRLVPADAPHQRAVVCNQLGLVYAQGTEWDQAMDNYREAIHLFEAGGERFYAGGTRRNVASMLLTRGRVEEAQLWARAALADYEAVGPSAADEVARTKEMLATMEGA